MDGRARRNIDGDRADLEASVTENLCGCVAVFLARLSKVLTHLGAAMMWRV